MQRQQCQPGGLACGRGLAFDQKRLQGERERSAGQRLGRQQRCLPRALDILDEALQLLRTQRQALQRLPAGATAVPTGGGSAAWRSRCVASLGRKRVGVSTCDSRPCCDQRARRAALASAPRSAAVASRWRAPRRCSARRARRGRRATSHRAAALRATAGLNAVSSRCHSRSAFQTMIAAAARHGNQIQRRQRARRRMPASSRAPTADRSRSLNPCGTSSGRP